MAYQSLYRRYRSGTFGELVGQEHVVTALKNAIVEGRVGHAYLFSGPRGTGKTSTARILGKALNCTDLQPDGEPCTRCESCLSFAAGTSYDLHELDAASNNGVDAIRDLISKVALGSPGRTKVYILDEVHMLTAGAENALLKTLEEPPAHVVFVLATTEPHKVVPTIRSRTQHFEFELLPADKLERHVRWIADDAGLAVDDAMVEYVLRAGGGSARDTLSALDQVVAAGGVPRDDDAIAVVLGGLAGRDPGAVMAAVSEALRAGRDPRVIGETLLARLRDSFLAAMGAPLDHCSDTQAAEARAIASQMGPAAMTRSLEVLGSCLIDMRQAPDPRVDLEVALLRLTRPELDTDIAAVVARLERLEQGLGPAALAGASAPSAAASSGGVPVSGAAAHDAAGGAAADASGATAHDAPAVAPIAQPDVAPDQAAPTSSASPSQGAGAPATGGARRPADQARAELARQRGQAPAQPAAAPDPAPRATLGAARGTAAGGASAPGGPAAGVAESGDTAAGGATAAGDPAAGDAASGATATGDAATPSGGPAAGAAASGEAATPGAGSGRTDPADVVGATGIELGTDQSVAGSPGPASDASSGAAHVPSPAAATSSPAGAGGDVPGVAALEAAWEQVRGGLPGRAKSRFSGGRFVSSDDTGIVFGLPNAIHRDRCAECVDDVVTALSAHFGRAVTMRLVVDGEAVAPAPRSGQAAAPPATAPEEEEDIDLTELIDAAPDEAGGVELLTEAFPGAEIIDLPPS